VIYDFRGILEELYTLCGWLSLVGLREYAITSATKVRYGSQLLRALENFGIFYCSVAGTRQVNILSIAKTNCNYGVL
jgi:hypothetical protein